jgi:tetratricopeptide (TPR) repeat protein
MGRELNVNYFVEGSGQKIGDQIVLHVQLIDASTDRHLWSKQYRRKAGDIFDLQQEVARSIAEEIRAIITPEEQQRINRRPTENLQAYDLYLKGRERSTSMSRADRLESIEYYKQAIALDPTFALAYAMMALDYYYLDLWQTTKEFTNEISLNADKAMFYEPTLGESLVAKAVDYINRREYAEAEPYLEKALEYHPNSAEVLVFLTDFYAHHMLNTGKYLTYALKGIQLDIASQDSVGASYTYLRLGNALIQTGFVDESLKYIDKSMEYNPNNPFSKYIRAFVLYAKDGNLGRTRSLLIEEYNKDTTRFDILQDIGKVSYYLRDYPGAYEYYKKFLAYRESAALDVYRNENMTIGHVLELVGKDAKAKALIRDYKDFLDQDKSIYQNLGYMAYSVYEGDHTRAIEYLKKFAKEDNVQYWIILFMEDDPMIEPIKVNPEFKKYMGEAKARFWKNHETLRLKLQEEGLL